MYIAVTEHIKYLGLLLIGTCFEFWGCGETTTENSEAQRDEVPLNAVRDVQWKAFL